MQPHSLGFPYFHFVFTSPLASPSYRNTGYIIALRIISCGGHAVNARCADRRADSMAGEEINR